MSNICKYFSCVVAKITGRNCADYKTCQANKFYERYGEDYMSLGIGAMCDSSRLTEILNEANITERRNE